MSLFSAYNPNPGLYSSEKLSLHLTNHFTKLPLMQQQNLLSNKRAYRNTRIFCVLKMSQEYWHSQWTPQFIWVYQTVLIDPEIFSEDMNSL